MTPAPICDAATTEDVFLGGRLVVLQPAKGYRAGLDAVLLAAAVEAAEGASLTVLDVGAGVGTAGLCVAARLPTARVRLVERTPVLARLARRNVERNGLGARVEVVEQDIAAIGPSDDTIGNFDIVIANPPYLEHGRHRMPDDAVAAGAFGMAEGGLETWLRYMARRAAPRGRFVLIHRADALSTIFAAVGRRFGGLRVLPLHPRAGEPANRVIVLGRKGSRAPLQLLAGLALHDKGNAFTAPIDAVLREAAPLPGLGSSAAHRQP